jgi:hypothetical protein
VLETPDRPSERVVIREAWSTREETPTMADNTVKTFRIESSHKLSSDWLPASEFTRVHTDSSAAVATAIEGVDDPAKQEVRVVCVEDGEIIWRSTDHEYE